MTVPAGEDLLDTLRNARCNICGTVGSIDLSLVPTSPTGEPSRLPPEAREGLACEACGAISRERALIYVLGCMLGESGPLEHWPARASLRVLETSGYRGHPPRLARLFDYFNTRYAPITDLRETVDGRTTADLEDLPYPDGFFDVVLTAEVLEHVQRLEPALAELHRVLDGGGFAIISAPYIHAWPRTSVRVHRWHDRDVHLYPPEYHAEDTLVYRVFGRDLLDQLRALGFSVLYLRFSRPALAIPEIELIVASRASFIDASHFLLR